MCTLMTSSYGHKSWRNTNETALPFWRPSKKPASIAIRWNPTSVPLNYVVFEDSVASTKKRLQPNWTQPAKTRNSVAVATGWHTVAVMVEVLSLNKRTTCNHLIINLCNSIIKVGCAWGKSMKQEGLYTLGCAQTIWSCLHTQTQKWCHTTTTHQHITTAHRQVGTLLLPSCSLPYTSTTSLTMPATTTPMLTPTPTPARAANGCKNWSATSSLQLQLWFVSFYKWDNPTGPSNTIVEVPESHTSVALVRAFQKMLESFGLQYWVCSDAHSHCHDY